MAKKNILFLAHSNNDMDSFLPLIADLKKTGEYEPVVFFARTREETRASRVHDWLIDHMKVKILSFEDIESLPSLTGVLLCVLRYCAAATEMVPIKELAGRRDIRKYFLKLVYINTDRLFKRYSRRFFPPKKMDRFVDGMNAAMLVTDIQKIRKYPPYEDLRSYAVSSIVRRCKDTGVPFFMMPHGGATILDLGGKGEGGFFDFDPAGTCDEHGFFMPDILGLNGESQREGYSAVAGSDTEVLPLGAIRYDHGWVKKIEEISRNTLDRGLEKGVFTILYIVSPLGLDADEEHHKDVMRAVKDLPGAKLWVKNHPRYPWRFGSDGDASRVEVFRNEVDTTALMSRADLVISPLSSTLLQAVSTGKPVILYDWWRADAKFKGRTAFDGSPCVLRASNAGELYERCREVMAGKRPNERDSERFYMTRISEGLKKDESIISRYTDVVKKFAR